MSPISRFSFDADTKRILRLAGWTENRRVSADNWIRELSQRGATVFPLVTQVLENLGGLEIHPPRDPEGLFMPSEIVVNPSVVASEFDRVEIWQEDFGLTLFPLGEVFRYSILLLASDGRFFAGGLGVFELLGNSVESTMALLCLGRTPPTSFNKGQ